MPLHAISSQDTNRQETTNGNPGDVLIPSTQGWVKIEPGQTFKIGEKIWEILEVSPRAQKCHIVIPLLEGGSKILKQEIPFFNCLNLSEINNDEPSKREIWGLTLASLICKADMSLCHWEHTMAISNLTLEDASSPSVI